MKLLHLADCHLDAPLIDLGQAFKKAELRRQELKDTFSKAIDFAKEQNVNLILISGDLFEHKYVDKSTIGFISERFNKVSHIPVFISPGNHDPYTCNSYYNSYKWPQNVFIFDNTFQKVYLSNIDTNVWGVGFNDFYLNKCMVKEIDHSEKDKINILITHGTLGESKIDAKYHPLDSSYIYDIGFDYCALGHIHKLSIDNKNNVCYPGSLEPNGFDETGEHGVILADISKDFKDIKFYPLALRQYIIKDLDVSGLLDSEELLDKIRSFVNTFSSKKHFYKIVLTGELNDFTIDTEFLEEYFKSDFYFLKFEDKTFESYDYDEIEKEHNLRGIFVKKMNQLILKSEPQDKQMLEKALQYGLDALTKGEIKV